MACPRCGGTAHVLVSPGLAQCTGSVMVDTGAPPSGAFGPSQIPQPCGQRYQVATTGPSLGTCTCGMGAIAQCVSCSAPRCLDHAFRRSDRLHCADCAQAIDDQRRQDADAARASAEARLLAALARVTPEVIERAERARSITHDVRGAERLEPGSACPEHGLPCRLERGHRTSKRWKRASFTSHYGLPIAIASDRFVVDGRGHVYEMHSYEGETHPRHRISIGPVAPPDVFDELGSRLTGKIDGSPIDGIERLTEWVERLVASSPPTGPAS